MNIYEDGELVCHYEYDEGLRLVRENNKKLNKTVIYSYDKGDVTSSTEYYYDGNKLVVQFNNDLMLFNYGVNGIEGFTYRGYEYHYKKNLLGDIIAIVDSTNTEIVRYIYDAYGNHKTYYLNEGTFVDIETQTSYSIDKPQSYEVALENPFRYRGYYYDIENNLYYLMSRYYDPQTGRFISMDSVEYLKPNSINGLNLYSYCGNNPINNVDSSGHFFFSALLIGAIVGASIGFGGTVLADYVDDGKVFNGSVGTGSYIANTLVGGLIGALTGSIASSSFSLTYPTLQFAQITAGGELALGSISVGATTATISGTSIINALGLAGVTIMGVRIGKSGGYRIDHHYPNDHAPTHVHISGDDGMTRVDINGNPIQGDRPMTAGEKKAFWRLIKKLLRH